MNAAVWVGSAVFFIIGAQPGAVSAEVQFLLGAKNFPYFGIAISQFISARFFNLFLACSIIALLHLTVETVYLGRSHSRFWPGTLVILFVFALLQSAWLQPNLQKWHRARYAANITAEQRSVAHRSFNRWSVTTQALNFLATAAIALYLWRVANPPETTRFVSATKFRS